MGLSKAMMEKSMIAKSRFQGKNETILCASRYGNVMASRGSVIPLFINQIKMNKPITITDPNMTRFLMSLEDSVNLVLHAFKNSDQGDIYVQKSPASTVMDLAKALKKLLNKESEVKIIGTRHGEKLFETLISREEMVKVVDQDKYYRIPADNRDLNYDEYFIQGSNAISDSADYTSHNTNQLDIDQIVSVISKLDLSEDFNV